MAVEEQSSREQEREYPVEGCDSYGAKSEDVDAYSTLLGGMSLVPAPYGVQGHRYRYTTQDRGKVVDRVRHHRRVDRGADLLDNNSKGSFRDPVAIDECHRTTQLGRDQSRLVTARTASDDDDSCHAAHPVMS